ncbi:MAG: hypothetical protein IPM66_18655 [Acidobacteriota bacterium]|nr:MAG: hypothetical protein IPM66_18655 [Acidobacteriota bacterium]
MQIRFRRSGKREKSAGLIPRLRRQRGSIMALTAVMITAMIGLSALSIDLGYVFSARNQYQNGIDAATIAAAAGLRVTIESDLNSPHQNTLIRAMAVQYASYNQVRRYTDPDPEAGPQPNSNDIVLDPTAVTIDTSTSPPRVVIDASLPTPLLFAGIFGISSINMNAFSTATIYPVDGGTGTMASCWRPLLLPDSFYDSSNVVRYVGDPTRGGFNLPDQTGDYYRSRFAVGARDTYPFVDGLSSIGAGVTGLRDTALLSEVGSVTIMGQFVNFSRDYYRIADFSSFPQTTFDTLSVGDLANFGYCGQLRVGQDIPVYSATDFTVYDQVRVGLQSLKGRTNDSIDQSIKGQYLYLKSASYPGPNTHGAIIPVLLFNPVELVRNPNSNLLRVTNIGLLFLESVQADGSIQGFFVREIISGGTPIDATNFAADSLPSFSRNWLPQAVQLLR